MSDTQDSRMRLQKYMAACGAASRRGAEKIIAEGRVSVNGVTADTPGLTVDPNTDKVTLDGKPLKLETLRYYLLNKPRGYVCTSAEFENEKSVQALLPDGERLYTVGRLDKNTEGLIIITNDGALTQRVTHPSHRIDKTYLTRVRGTLTDREADRLRRGVVIDDEGRRTLTAPAEIKVLRTTPEFSTLEITIHEGRKRQVRKMCEAVGHVVTGLRRIREGSLTLGNLKPGEYRALTPAEVRELKHE